MAIDVYGWAIKQGIAGIGALAPIAGRDFWALPERADVQFALGNWSANYAVPGVGIPPQFARAIKCTSGPNGVFQFKLPLGASEIYVPDDGPIYWLIHDPITPLTFRGILPPKVATTDLKTLTQTHGWTISTAIVNSQISTSRYGTLAFTVSTGTEITVQLVPPMPSAAYAPVVGAALDDLAETGYAAFVKPGWTVTQFTVRLSDPVPAGRQVLVPYHALG